MVLLELVAYNVVTVVLVCVIVLLALWIRWVKGHYNVFETLGIPCPKPKFLFGNALDFANKLAIDVFGEWSKKFGKVFGFYEGIRPSIVVTSPTLAHEILVKNFQYFADRPIIHPFLWNAEIHSLQHNNGLPWKRQRQAVSAGMSGRCIREMFPTINEITETLLSTMDKLMKENPEGIYVDGLMERYSMDWFGQAALGYHSNSLGDEKEIFIRYLRGVHESVAPDNEITGIARLFPSLTPIVRHLDKKHKRESVEMYEEVSTFIQSMKDRPACPLLHHLRTRIVVNDTVHVYDDVVEDFNSEEQHARATHGEEADKIVSTGKADTELLKPSNILSSDEDIRNETRRRRGPGIASTGSISGTFDKSSNKNFKEKVFLNGTTLAAPLDPASAENNTNPAPADNYSTFTTSELPPVSTLLPSAPLSPSSFSSSSSSVLSSSSSSTKKPVFLENSTNLFSTCMKKTSTFQNTEIEVNDASSSSSPFLSKTLHATGCNGDTNTSFHTSSPCPETLLQNAHSSVEEHKMNGTASRASRRKSSSGEINLACMNRRRSHVEERLNFSVDKQKSRLNDTEITGEIMGLAGGGIGPFSSALAFTLYCLALHEDEQIKIREEVDRVIPCDGEVTVEDVQHLEGVERFFYESIRMFPVAPGVSRTCVEDCTINGVHFNKGMVVRVITSAMYNSDEYFEDADKFNPDRFKGPLNPAWLPFGLGPRKCVGDRLALVVIKMAVARILKRFSVHKSDSTEIPLTLALRPFLMARDGIHVRLVPRSST